MAQLVRVPLIVKGGFSRSAPKIRTADYKKSLVVSTRTWLGLPLGKKKMLDGRGRACMVHS